MTKRDNLAETIVVERTLDAPVERVWTALTDADEMRQWYFDLKEFKSEIGCEFEFVVEHEGHSYHHLCKVTEVIPERKIAYTWRYKGEPGNSLVTFELFPDGDKTRLKLTHTGIETFPKTPAYARKNFETGWTAIIGSELKRFVENFERRIMNEKTTEKTSLAIKRFINASPARVYEVWTDPAQLKEWWGPEGVRTRTFTADARVGGKYRWDLFNQEGEEMSVFGEYRELVPGKKIVFTWKWDEDENWETCNSVVTIELSGRDGGTELILRHEKLPSEESRDRHNEGWNSVLDRFEKFFSK